MGKKKLIIFGIICITIIVASLGVYFELGLKQPPSPTQPSLSENDYAVYKQEYSWLGLNGSESLTRYVYWNITSKQDNIANLQVLYSWYNGPSSNLTFPETVNNITVDMTNRDILGKQSSNLPFGSFFPYWISPSVSKGDHISISIGQASVYQAQETVQAINSRVDCWLLSFVVQGDDEYATYHRFYDKATGICLETQVDIVLNGTPIHFDETIERTNISSLYKL